MQPQNILVVFAKLNYDFAIFRNRLVYNYLCDIAKLENLVKPS
jgi:hypothetical protein